MRVPFDALVLAAVVDECAPLVGGRVLDVRQPDKGSLALGFENGALYLNGEPQVARAHLTSRRIEGPPRDHFGGRCVRALRDKTLLEMTQPAGDRALLLRFEGGWELYGEFVGPHANLRLVREGIVVAVARPGGAGPQEGDAYAPPGGAFAGGPSPFLRRLADARGVPHQELGRPWSHGLAGETGAYPIPVDALGLEWSPRDSISTALEIAYARWATVERRENLRKSLQGRLSRVLTARETGLRDLAEAQSQGRGAGRWQREAELIQAYGPHATGDVIEGFDHEGQPWTFRLEEGHTWKEAAEARFDRARHAKSGAASAEGRMADLRASRDDLRGVLQAIEEAPDLKTLEKIQAQSLTRRWISAPAESSSSKPDGPKPFDGHKVRQIEGPDGFLILYGETADANDWLTVRGSHPADLWFHVRGATGAHVVIRTNKKPERVSPAAIREAARLAAKNSAAKHAKYVPVDYTERRYVRKPRGARPGTVEYSRAKTIYVDEV